MSKMRKDFEVRTNDPRLHEDDRMCTLQSSMVSEDPRHPEVFAVCACGRAKEFYAAEVDGYILVCNGFLILKYRKESAWSFKFKPGA
jgi:hypothetical protein